MSLITKDNTNRNFKGQLHDEEVLCFTRQHWVVFLQHIFIYLIIGLLFLGYTFLIATDLVSSLLGEAGITTARLLVVAASIYPLHRFFIGIFNYYLKTIVITDHRVVQLDKTLYLNDNRDAVGLVEIQDVTMKQHGIMQTLLDYGSIELVVSSPGELKCFKYVPNPGYHFRKINKAKRLQLLGVDQNEREHRGVVREVELPTVAVKE
ncbi:hypothetical protein CO046_03815 [Candidatus Peregrinibacteria bacterium CG_4_9_14_0_2_um_filter_53_11]|nr:MAG: hypothetical protein CO046_03815 [Candidatus Peregrinibacteria bacterium CG_4_9_14_0_2_um_filter_53_11]